MTTLAIIGGSGLSRMEGLTVNRREMIKTPFGAPSCPILFGEFSGMPVAFLARHGHKHQIPPHQINYCANLWALHSVGIERVVAVGTVGGISDDCKPGTVVVPDQIIDYTHGRENSFYDGSHGLNGVTVRAIDFTEPYNPTLRQALIDAGVDCGETVLTNGTYGVSSGPRLETAAEVLRMERDGCSIVGMTGMPEAALARELEMAYACCAVVVRRAAGKAGPIDTDALPDSVKSGTKVARNLLASAMVKLIDTA